MANHTIMGSFKEDQKKVAQARKNLERAETTFYREKIKILKDRDPNTLAEVEGQLASSNQAYLEAKNVLSESIGVLYSNHQFKEAAAAMDASIPILFLPVRLETRFITKGNNQELWVRIYPDDIHIHSHEPLLTDQEAEHGKHYWKSLAASNREGGEEEEQDAKKEKAWQTLNEMSGIQRALWIVKQTKPKNWTVDLNVTDNELEFPDRMETKKYDWTRAPRTQILPDKFAVSIIKGSRVVSMKLGNQIPDTVFLGPDPFKAEEAYKKDGDKITFDDSFAWITDFDEAIRQGLGVKIPLQASHFNRTKIDQVVVMGLLSSASPEEGKALLEQLIENHHYSRKGFSFLPQSSPTNNTEESGSTYEKNEDYLPKGYYDGSDIVNLDDQPNAGGNNFAEYLGIKSDILKEVDHADMVESFEALAMNKAIYPSTIGNFVEVLADPVLAKSAHPKLRDFFNNHVCASGHVPCIRVGDQPYGTLITSDLSRWQDNDTFHSGVTKALSTLQSKWDQITKAKVAHVGKTGDPGELMLNILGLHPGSISFKQRLGHLPDIWYTMKAPNQLHGGFVHKQTEITQFLEAMGFNRGENAYPYISNLSFYDFVNNINSNHLVDRKQPSATRFLQRDKITKQNYIEWLASIRKIKDFEKKISGVRAPRSILYLLLRHAILLELKRAAEVIYTKAKVPYKRVAFEKSVYNFNTKTNDLSEWEILFGVPKKVNATKLNIAAPIGDHILTMRGNAEAAKNLKEMREAMNVLAKLPTSKLNKYLTDHLDLCTYRLDAWQTGLFYRKLLSMRKQNPQGVYLGAYGLVENLKPASKTEVSVPDALKPEGNRPVNKLNKNAGFIHTPSLNHATAAGVLLSGYQNHASKTNPGTFAINLSSERVRRALFVLEGIQNNQSLEALLGYQFERALHDITTDNPANNLNQYILRVREKFPIVNNSIPQQGSEAQEVISPFSVVNGMKVIKASNSDLQSLIGNNAHATLILKEKNRLEDTLDALSDLMLSEAAFQATQGKTDRTAAILNSLKNAQVPPELEVNRTPRSTHISITNRIAIHFDHRASGKIMENWSGEASPRSRVEPGLNRWLSEVFGNPTKTICSAAHIDSDGNQFQQKTIRLSELGLQPIDLIYSAGEDIQSGAKELEYLVAKVYNQKVNVPLENKIKIMFEPDSVASSKRSFAAMLPLLRSLRLLITTSRPANGKDYRPKSKKVVKNPLLLFGYNAPELRSRIKDAWERLKAEVAKVNSKAPNSMQPKSKTNPANFKQLYKFYHESGGSREYIEDIPFTNSAINVLLSFLEKANLYGVKVSYPNQFDRNNSEHVADLVAIVGGIVETVNRKIKLGKDKLDAALGQPVDKKVRLLIESGKAVLGDDFVAIPKFKFTNAADVASNLKENTSKQLLKFISEKEGTSTDLALETWIESAAQVRPNVRHLEHVRMISESQGGTELEFMPAQMPFKANDTWLAVEFPKIDERTGEPYDIKDDTICLSIQGDTAKKTTALQCALLVEEWTEFIPNEKEVTGVAFNYDQPNATSPNTMLLAVEPTGSPNWDWDILMGIVHDTIRRAKSRAVEPAQLLEDVAMDTLSPMTVANFDLNKTSVSLDYLVTNDEFLTKMQSKNFELYKNISFNTD